MTVSVIRRAIGAGVVAALIGGVPAAAQTPSRTEAQLLSQTTPGPQQLGAMLELIKLYADQQRFDEAAGMLARASQVVQQQRATTTRAMLSDTVAGTPVTTAIRLGPTQQAPVKIRDVKPEYPQIAQTARVAGIVILEATVGPDGRVKDARVL